LRLHIEQPLARIAGEGGERSEAGEGNPGTKCYHRAIRAGTSGTALDYIDCFGILGPLPILGHGEWLNEADLNRIAATGTHICHNCSSNFRPRKAPELEPSLVIAETARAPWGGHGALIVERAGRWGGHLGRDDLPLS